MNEQPEALRLADALMEPVVLDKHAMQAAAELRRLHEESIQARRTGEYWKAEHLAGNNRITTLEAALRQAVEAFELYQSKMSVEMFDAAITAAKQALGEA